MRENPGLRDEPDRDAAEVRPRQPQLDGKRAGDQADQRDDERFDVAEAAVLQEEHDEHVERSEADAPDQRQAEQQVERDRRADHFRQVARRDRDLAQQPQHDRRRPRVAVAAGLRQVAAAGDPQPRRERLQQDRHQVGDHDHAEQRVAVPRAAGEVGRPISRVHVADGDEIAGTGEREQLSPEAGAECGMAIEPWTSGRLTLEDGRRQPRAVDVGVSVAIVLKFERSKTLGNYNMDQPGVEAQDCTQYW